MVCEKPRVLIVDDDEAICDGLSDELSDQGYLCTTAFNGDIALAELAANRFDVVLLDIKLPRRSGIEVLKEIQLSHCSAVPIMITCINEVDTAVDAMKTGAFDYIVKPFDLDRVNAGIHAALDSLRREKLDYQAALCVGNQEKDKADVAEGFDQMNAIAYGVQVRHGVRFTHSEVVIRETADIAQRLGIRKKAIQSWVAARVKRDSERSAVIESLLAKLERTRFAQTMLRITQTHRYMPKRSKYDN